MKKLTSSNRCCLGDKPRLWRFNKGAVALFITILLVFFNGAALAAPPPPPSPDSPQNVSFTLEGCRFGSLAAGYNLEAKNFICSDNAYTTGDLLPGWNELDLVPHRLTAKATNAAPSSQTYKVAIVFDAKNAGHPGYDKIDLVKLTGTTCTLAIGDQQTAVSGVGGTDESIYRILTITQAKDTECQIDYVGRLAVGAHLFPGASLHANVTQADLTTGGIGARDVSLPVKEILPQSISKTHDGRQSSNHIWNITKSAPATIDFGDVCAADQTFKKSATITVDFQKLPATLGDITLVTNVTASNPAHRSVTVNVSDEIRSGTTELNTLASDPVIVAAGQSQLVLTHSYTVPNGTNAPNDVATASYTDTVFGVPVPGTTTAEANATIQAGNISNSTATIDDVEGVITGDGLTYSADSFSGLIGNFDGYVAKDPTTGQVKWLSGSQENGGSVQFSKTIYLDGKRVTSGILPDTAHLNGSDGYKAEYPQTINISSSASVKLSFSKTIPDVLDSNEKIEVVFHISRAGDKDYSRDEIFTFVSGGDTTQTINLTGLVPDSYTVTETSSTFYPCSTCQSVINPLTSDTPSQTVNLSKNADGIVPNCSGTLAFENKLRDKDFAKVNVAKVTDPTLKTDDLDYNWTFTLNPSGNTATAKADAVAVLFNGSGGQPLLLAEGSYTMTETTKTGWDLTNVTNPDGSKPNPITNACTFVVDYPEDYGKTFACTFSNTKRGKAEVIKTVSTKPITGTQAYTFQLREGASTTSEGTTLETQVANVSNGGVLSFTKLLIPGNTYQMCEDVLPGWNTNLGNLPNTLFVPNSVIPPTLPNPNVNNMTICVDFKVSAGETKSFTVDNAPPPGGRGLTIGFWKNWSSCTKGGQKPVLDQTMAKATPPGIQVGSLYLLGNPLPSNPDIAPDCSKAVNLLNKSTSISGKKMASDPLFNMAAQLVATELNLAAGAYTCGNVVSNVQNANNLLIKYKFTGDGYTGKLSAADATLANTLATTLDNYNNNRTGVCN